MNRLKNKTTFALTFLPSWYPNWKFKDRVEEIKYVSTCIQIFRSVAILVRKFLKIFLAVGWLVVVEKKRRSKTFYRLRDIGLSIVK